MRGALLLLFFCLASLACKKKKTELARYNINIDSTFSMVTYGVNALVSDSGVTQYRLISPEWYIYDRNPEPYWLFPKGLRVEQFDEANQTLAQIQADSGSYTQPTREWNLYGHVQVYNLKGDRFYAPMLRWSRADSTFSCPDTVLIITPDRTLHGSNFVSNETFTRYSFTNNSGSATVQDDL